MKMDGYRAIRSRPRRLFSRVCTLHTLSPLYIYTLEPQRLFARVCSLHTLSPSPDLNKTVLTSLSSPSLLVKEPARSRSLGNGKRCTVDAVTVGKGGNPLSAVLSSFTQRRRGRASDPFFLDVVHSVGRSGLPPPT